VTHFFLKILSSSFSDRTIPRFCGTGLLAYVIVPGMLVMWDRILDHMDTNEVKK
jgi:hypothetical protein